MTEEVPLICYNGCRIPTGTPMFPAVRHEKNRRGRWERIETFVVNCPGRIHIEDTGWNYHDEAFKRGLVVVRREREAMRLRAEST